MFSAGGSCQNKIRKIVELTVDGMLFGRYSYGMRWQWLLHVFSFWWKGIPMGICCEFYLNDVLDVLFFDELPRVGDYVMIDPELHRFTELERKISEHPVPTFTRVVSVLHQPAMAEADRRTVLVLEPAEDPVVLHRNAAFGRV